MTINSHRNPTIQTYTDEEVMAAIRNANVVGNLTVKWFLQESKPYAFRYWRKKYSRLSNEEWESIFSDADLKLLTRIKKGLTLKEGTKLKTYYTSVVGYSILDHYESQKKEETPIPSDASTGITQLEIQTFEASQIAKLVQEKFLQITGNPEQVAVILLVSKGYAYKEIVQKTNYKSEGACRNAYLKGKKKIIEYINNYPNERKQLRNWLLGH